MAVVAGIAFFTFRAGLALFPLVASRYPIKKWAALAALGMAAFYLLLSGAEVATQRAFIMTAIVLIGVVFDRPALTLRTICVAALVLLRCDQTGCVARLADGRAAALSLAADALSEDCEIAALVVTARNAPPGCAAIKIDRNAARAGGAMTIRMEGGLLTVEAARPGTQDRPWAKRASTPPAPSRPVPPRDATPRPADLEADDAPSVAPE